MGGIIRFAMWSIDTDLVSEEGWKSDLCTEAQFTSVHETAVIPLWATTCGMVDGRKCNSHHALKSTTICPEKQSNSEKKSDIKLNVRWIMHVRCKTPLYRYLSDWLVQWGSISAPSLILHRLLLSISNLYIKIKKTLFFFSLFFPSLGQQVVYSRVFWEDSCEPFDDPCALTIEDNYPIWLKQKTLYNK